MSRPNRKKRRLKLALMARSPADLPAIGPGISRNESWRAALAWTAEGGCPYACITLMVLLCFPSLFQFFFWLRVKCKVRTSTDTLEVGVRAPEFSLAAANREETFSLAGLLERGTLILEFLRGTW